MVAKVMGIDHVIDDLAGKPGGLERAQLIDDYETFAKGPPFAQSQRQAQILTRHRTLAG